jgi:glycogen debranching enzyme
MAKEVSPTQTPEQQPSQPTGGRKQFSPEEKHERRNRVLKQGANSLAQDISGAVVIKNGDVFFLTEKDGSVPLHAEHGFGLYYHDCRYMNGYEMHLDGQPFDVLVSSATRGFMSVFELTTPDIHMQDGKLIPKQTIGIKWERLIESDKTSLYDLITLTNYGMQDIAFPLSLCFQCGFEDIFEVRGAPPEKRGTLHPPAWRDKMLVFAYDGADAVYRALSIQFEQVPHQVKDGTAYYQISLGSHQSMQLLVMFQIIEIAEKDKQQIHEQSLPDLQALQSFQHQAQKEWLRYYTGIKTNSLVLSDVMHRSLSDLRILRSTLFNDKYFAAGIPWYVALFGRDSCITSLQLLAFNPVIAEQTLRLLARYQGTKTSDWQDEAPGKIMHELRVGEMAHLDEVPQIPYYGSVDSTPLFLILLAEHARWTGQLDLFNELRPHVENALSWMAHNCASTGFGYLTYSSQSKAGLSNQGWKDSGDSIMNKDGSLAAPPIALPEVQGYMYLALTRIADLYRRAGDGNRAQQILKQADDLRIRFNQDFWMGDEGCYCLGLEKGRRQLQVIASNAGQVLWSGIADVDKAKKTAARLMQPDMYSGWGIRTLSSSEVRYNPIGYHLGTVWPHDNSLIAAGFREYGETGHLLRLFKGMVAVANRFNNFRLPECFAGFTQEAYPMPVRYPVACHPQAWAAGSLPYLLTSLLGLQPDGFNKRLEIHSPVLPDYIDYVELEGIQVGGGRVHLRFERKQDNQAEFKVLHQEGDITVAAASQGGKVT